MVRRKKLISIEVSSNKKKIKLSEKFHLDDGGVYKGRSNHRERAREVDDTRDTKVEIPIDYREIETVEVNNNCIVFVY